MAGSIDAIVVTYRTGPTLRRCLSRLAACSDVATVIVVDNGNPPEDERWMDAWARATPHAQILRGAGNIGFGAACNRGAARAKGAHLLFVNPDLEIAPDAPAALRAVAEARPCPVIVGGRPLGPDGLEQRGARRDLATPWSMLVAGLGLGRFERIAPLFRDPHRERDALPDHPIQVAAVSGALFLTPRVALAHVGGFDEAYFLHVEDIDLCRRLRDSGGEVWFHPHATGLHAGATSAVGSAFVEGHKARSFARYFRKFARGPLDRVGGEIAALALGVGFRLRGWLRDRRRRAA